MKNRSAASKHGDSSVTAKAETRNGEGLQDSPLVVQSNGLAPRLLDYKAGSRYLSLSYWSLLTLVLNGETAPVKFGKRVLLDRLSLDEWVEKNREGVSEMVKKRLRRSRLDRCFARCWFQVWLDGLGI